MLRFADDFTLLGDNKDELEDAQNRMNRILVDWIKMISNKSRETRDCHLLDPRWNGLLYMSKGLFLPP